MNKSTQNPIVPGLLAPLVLLVVTGISSPVVMASESWSITQLTDTDDWE